MGLASLLAHTLGGFAKNARVTSPLIQMPDAADLLAAVALVPAGRWAVGVSGGADSVALLLLLLGRADLSLHVVHLDHETRGDAGAADAAFVRDLAARRGVPAIVARRRDVEPALTSPPANESSRFRACRLALFRRVAADHALDGVLLAHHADDAAETILHRLLRGSGPAGLAPIAPRTTVGGLTILRPLLGVRRAALRAFLEGGAHAWREDASNASDRYGRNRLRKTLHDRPDLTDALLRLGAACARLRDWTRAAAPTLGPTFPARRLAHLPPVLARASAARWLAERGVPAGELDPAVVARLLDMAADAATPARRDFPGAITVRRRRGELFVDPVPGVHRGAGSGGNSGG